MAWHIMNRNISFKIVVTYLLPINHTVQDVYFVSHF